MSDNYNICIKELEFYFLKRKVKFNESIELIPNYDNQLTEWWNDNDYDIFLKNYKEIITKYIKKNNMNYNDDNIKKALWEINNIPE